ncbi:peptidoglycan L-alanyl-D-glutamate endopeptidase CwlK [Terribacillus aidingensis]|uniref:Peptidoglycan L-alanyl-D-glutamate endopeptidase CwlK n=1 Tax=Terribacillus aidingensis TaxID=586416 RepID=A0A285P761_9BACI|nr:M15 family metallopeptidase [Terribacillus aidingensis]SNZ17107.1 peptidoglycan L-alanyl-D-glutamate endopeptidase CwlK [Terribacillus aidingensis]
MHWKRIILTTVLMTVAALILFGFLHIEQLPKNSTPVADTDAADINGLHPTVEKNMHKLIDKSADIGIPIIITDDFRSKKEQDKLYAQGRTTEGQIVTNVQGGESMHNYGLAIDFALQPEPGNVIWDMEYDGNNNGESDWLEVVEIAKDLGFHWGGDWTEFKDYPHLEMHINW